MSEQLTVKDEILINATSEKVWEVLIKPKYIAQWHPSCFYLLKNTSKLLKITINSRKLRKMQTKFCLVPFE